MTCSFGNLENIAHFLAGLDYPYIVLQPPELREALHQLATRAGQMASRTPSERHLETLAPKVPAVQTPHNHTKENRSASNPGCQT